MFYLFVGIYLAGAFFVGRVFHGLYSGKTSKTNAVVIGVFSGLTLFLAPVHMMIYEDFRETYWIRRRIEAHRRYQDYLNGH